MHHFPRALILTLLAALAVAAPAQASPGLLAGIADDGVTQRSPTLGALVVPQWQAAGVDVARVMVIWNYVAPGRDALRQPAGFHASDPNDPQYAWGDMDRTIGQLLAAGIKPVITVTGPAPIWGTQVPSLRNSRHKPDPAKFAQFARAVATRFAAATDQYILWNEPNIEQWLQPQSDCTGTRCTPAAPGIYRRIANKAIPAIKAGDPGADVYFPALASSGAAVIKRGRDNLKPLPFLRALGCVDAKYRPERRSAYCRTGFKPVDGGGIAYHPHSTLRAPDQSDPDRDKAAFADIPRLFAAVDAIQKAGGLLHDGSRTRRFEFWFTEFGYQTNPPDPVLGVSLEQQSRYVQQATYVCWRNPRIRMVVQYLWRDDPIGNGSRFSGWQSAPYGFDGRAKPLAKAFPNPFWVDLPRGRRTATVWGQVRPGTATEVTVQSRRAGTSGWKLVRKVLTDVRGYFSFPQVVNTKTTFRFQYAGASQQTATTPVVPPTPETGGASASAVPGPVRTVTSSAWTVKPVKARAAKQRR